MRPFLIAALLAVASSSAVGMTAEELAELSASADASLARMRQADVDRAQEVRDRAFEACERLWAADADAAILNPVCFDVFTGNGLPD